MRLYELHFHLLDLYETVINPSTESRIRQGAPRLQCGRFRAHFLLNHMPIYEYRCADCHRRVSHLYQTFAAASAAEPACTSCGSRNLSRLVSRVFQLKSEDAQLDDLADPSSFGDLDENDPKSVARWARKLGQQMGEDLGDDWGDMVDRLEAGEDLGEEGAGAGESEADLGGVGADASDAE